MNFKATSLLEMIPLKESKKNEVHEPVFSCHLSKDELKQIKEVPFSVPQFPIHTQSTERAVQAVTKAAAQVYGEVKRDMLVRAQIAHRKLLPVFKTKKNMLASSL